MVHGMWRIKCFALYCPALPHHASLPLPVPLPLPRASAPSPSFLALLQAEQLGAYVALMRSCWAQDPADRPSFEDIVERLRCWVLDR